MFRNLPAPICTKWEEKVSEYPEFSESASFMKNRALLKNQPNVITEEPNERRKKFEDHVRFYKGNADQEKDEENAKSHCPFHNLDGHVLAESKAFSHKTLQERIDWLKQAELCFLWSTKGHLSKECKQKVECKKCGSSRHQTILHREKTVVDGGEITSEQTKNNESNQLSVDLLAAKSSYLIYIIPTTNNNEQLARKEFEGY